MRRLESALELTRFLANRSSYGPKSALEPSQGCPWPLPARLFRRLPGGFAGWLCLKRGKDAGRSQGPRSGIRRIDFDFPIPDRMVSPALFCDQAGNRLLVTRTFRLPSSCSGRVRDPPELEGDHSPRSRSRQPTLAMHRPASFRSGRVRDPPVVYPKPSFDMPVRVRRYLPPKQLDWTPPPS